MIRASSSPRSKISIFSAKYSPGHKNELQENSLYITTLIGQGSAFFRLDFEPYHLYVNGAIRIRLIYSKELIGK